MAEIYNLAELLKNMSPELEVGEYVFCSVSGSYSDYAHLHPLGSFSETEGLTLILKAEIAESEGIAYECKYSKISIRMHSALNAVGLTAAISTKLASYSISANVVAGFYHDHIFVQTEKANQALLALTELGSSSGTTT